MTKKRIAIIGPESTGKSTLSEDLSNHYKEPWVPEYAREYLEKLGRPYVREDLIEIAKGQIREEENFLPKSKNLLICDTNLVVIKIWSEYKYGDVDKQIMEMLNSRYYDLHILTNIDLPWEEDPLREHPDEREELLLHYQNHLFERNINYTLVSGDKETRLNQSIQAIDEIL